MLMKSVIPCIINCCRVVHWKVICEYRRTHSFISLHNVCALNGCVCIVLSSPVNKRININFTTFNADIMLRSIKHRISVTVHNLVNIFQRRIHNIKLGNQYKWRYLFLVLVSWWSRSLAFHQQHHICLHYRE